MPRDLFAASASQPRDLFADMGPSAASTQGTTSTTSGATPRAPNLLGNQMGDPLADYNVDTRSGAPFGARAGASVKITPAGKRSYLESKFGKGNVAQRADGALLFRKPGGAWTKVDETGLSLRDMTADLVGPAIETAPAVIGPFIDPAAATPPAQGGLLAAGRALRQGASSLLPGSDQMSIGQRAGDLALTGILGAGTTVGVNKLASAFDTVRPHNLIARTVQKQADKPYAAKGAKLEAQTGIPLTLGQRTGSRGVLMVEGVARQHPASADQVFAFDQKATRAAQQRLNSILDGLDKRGMGPIGTGQQVEQAFTGAVDRAVKQRELQAAFDYGTARKLAGNRPIINPANLRSELEQIISEHGGPGAGREGAKIVAQARAMLKDIGKPGAQAMDMYQPQTAAERGRLTLDNFIRRRSQYSKASAGTGQIFNDIDTRASRALSGRLAAAMNRDIADTAADPAIHPDLARELVGANKNYQQHSQAIDELGQTVLGRLFNGKYDQAPEAIADKFFRMRPSELRSAASILQQQDPQALAAVKRHMLETWMDKARPSSSQQAAPGVKFSPAKFNSALPDDSVLRSVFSRQEYVQIKQVSKALERVADRAGMEGSQTGRITMALSVLKAMFSTNPLHIAQGVGTVLAPRKIAQAMTTPQGRQAVLTLTRTKPGTKMAGRAITNLMAVAGGAQTNALESLGVLPSQQFDRQ